MNSKWAGFTIIEVTIFIAISGLLLLVAFAGVSNLTNRTRFTDTMNGLQSFLQRQYGEIVSGTNIRSDNQGCAAMPSTKTGESNDTCLYMGRMIRFSEGSTDILTYDVVSQAKASGTSLTDQYMAMKPITINEQRSTLGWGSIFKSGRTTLAPQRSINTLVFIRSPESARIITYLFDSSTMSLYDSLPAKSALSNPAVSQASLCIADTPSSGSPIAAIRLTGGTGPAAIVVNPEPSVGGGAEC